MRTYKSFTVGKTAIDALNEDFLQRKRNNDFASLINQVLPELAPLEDALKTPFIDRKQHALELLQAIERLKPHIDKTYILQAIKDLEVNETDALKTLEQMGMQVDLSDDLVINILGCVKDLLGTKELKYLVQSLDNILQSIKGQIIQAASQVEFFAPLLLTTLYRNSVELSVLAQGVESNQLIAHSLNYAEMFIDLLDRIGPYLDLPTDLKVLYQQGNCSAVLEQLRALKLRDQLVNDLIEITQILLEQNENEKKKIPERIQTKLRAMQQAQETQLGRDLVSTDSFKLEFSPGVVDELGLQAEDQPNLNSNDNLGASSENSPRFNKLRNYLATPRFALDEKAVASVTNYLTCWSQSSFVSLGMNFINHLKLNTKSHVRSENLGIRLLVEPSAAEGKSKKVFIINGIQFKLKFIKDPDNKELGILTVTSNIGNVTKSLETADFYLGRFEDTDFKLNYQASCDQGNIELPESVTVEQNSEIVKVSPAASQVSEKNQVKTYSELSAHNHSSTWFNWALMGVLSAILLSPIIIPILATIFVATFSTVVTGIIFGGLLLLGLVIGSSIGYLIDRDSNSTQRTTNIEKSNGESLGNKNKHLSSTTTKLINRRLSDAERQANEGLSDEEQQVIQAIEALKQPLVRLCVKLKKELAKYKGKEFKEEEIKNNLQKQEDRDLEMALESDIKTLIFQGNYKRLLYFYNNLISFPGDSSEEGLLLYNRAKAAAIYLPEPEVTKEYMLLYELEKFIFNRFSSSLLISSFDEPNIKNLEYTLKEMLSQLNTEQIYSSYVNLIEYEHMQALADYFAKFVSKDKIDKSQFDKDIFLERVMAYNQQVFRKGSMEDHGVSSSSRPNVPHAKFGEGEISLPVEDAKTKLIN